LPLSVLGFPDLLYSICVYDLNAAHGAVEVHTHGMPETYWYLSSTPTPIISTQAKTGAADFLLDAPGTPAEGHRLPMVTTPTNRGIVLFRTLVNDEANIAEIDAARHDAACEPYKAADM
jgi:uncharacterized membrane protein